MSTSTSSASASTSMAALAQPAPLMTHTSRATLVADQQQQQRTYDPIDEFFGYTFGSSSTHESRHDRTQSVVLDTSDVPPPYVEESNLPAYTPYAEPITLAMYLFKFGFLFPPFWIFGAFILLSPLREPPTSSTSPAWMPEKTEAERQQIIAEMRKVELKWARRCLGAFFIFTLLAAAAGITAWAVLKH